MDGGASDADPEEAAAVEAATNAASEFLTGEPEEVDARRMTFDQAQAELADWGGGQPASVVGTPPPSQPVWLVNLRGVGVPPGPPAADPRPEGCLEIIVVLNTSPLEDIVIAGRRSDGC